MGDYTPNEVKNLVTDAMPKTEPVDINTELRKGMTLAIANLHSWLKDLDLKMDVLLGSNVFNKGASAEAVIIAARELMAKTVFTVHSIANENDRLRYEIEVIKTELKRISSIGVIKNG